MRPCPPLVLLVHLLGLTAAADDDPEAPIDPREFEDLMRKLVIKNDNSLPPEATPLPMQCLDKGCSKEWDGQGVCVDFSNTTTNFFENLGIKYDLSAGEKEERCGHKIQGKEDCCHCLKLPDECSQTEKCEISGGKCYVNGTEPHGSHQIGGNKFCNPRANCFCYSPTCVQTPRCSFSLGKCIPDDQIVPPGFDVHPELCEKGCKCLTHQDPACKETDACKKVGGKCYKQGDQPTGSDIVGKEMCNYKKKCYCYKEPGTTGCKPDHQCERAGGVCIRKDLVPPGTEMIDKTSCDLKAGCNCYNLTDSKCRQTEGCTDVHGQCISQDTPIPAGLSLVPDDDHQHHRCEKGCQCVGPDVPSCGPTPRCTAARGKCIKPNSPVPPGAINIPNACDGILESNCECWTVQCRPTRECSSHGGTCFKKGTEPKGSKLISIAACNNGKPDWQTIGKPDDAPCYCYKTPPVICAPTPGCTSAGGKCIGELDAIPTGLAIVPDDEHGHHECDRGCKCVGPVVQRCVATKKCSSISGQCLPGSMSGPVGATEVPDYCVDNCKCWVHLPTCVQTQECTAQRGICVPGIIPLPATSILQKLCQETCQCLRHSVPPINIVG